MILKKDQTTTGNAKKEIHLGLQTPPRHTPSPNHPLSSAPSSGSNNSSGKPSRSGCSRALSFLSGEEPITGIVSRSPGWTLGRTWAEQPFEDALSFEGWKRSWGQRGWSLLAWRRGGKGQMLKRFAGHQEKTGGWINRGSFSLSSYESPKSWNYLKYFTYSYISFISHLFPLFCSYSPVLLSFKSHPVLIPSSSCPFPVLVSFHCWAYVTFCRPFTSWKCCEQWFWA